MGKVKSGAREPPAKPKTADAERETAWQPQRS